MKETMRAFLLGKYRPEEDWDAQWRVFAFSGGGKGKDGEILENTVICFMPSCIRRGGRA